MTGDQEGTVEPNQVGVLRALAQEYSELEEEISGLEGLLSRLQEEEEALVGALELATAAANSPPGTSTHGASGRPRGGGALQRLEEALMLEDSDTSDDDSDGGPKTSTD